MMIPTEIHHQVDIAASSGRVWSVLCDLRHYDEWNPWIRRARGTVSEGAQLQLTVAPPDQDEEHITARVERVRPVTSISVVFDWPDVPGRRTRHEFRLDSTRAGTRLTQCHQVVHPGDTDDLDGATAGQLAGGVPFADRTHLALEMMSAALKARAER